MTKASTLSPAEMEILDRFCREGGLGAMMSPQVRYDGPGCPHSSCWHRMEWIDFKLELRGDLEGVYKPLVRAWWEGTGLLGRCPVCHEWIRFTTFEMETVDEALRPGIRGFRKTGIPWRSLPERQQMITRSTGYAVVRASGFETVDEVVFGQPGDLALLGARTLEGFGAAVDASNQRLVAAGPHPAA